MVMEIIVSVVLLVSGISALVLIHVCIVSRAFAGDGGDDNNVYDHDRGGGGHQNIVIFDEGRNVRVGVGGGRGIGKMLDEEVMMMMMESRIPCFSYREGRDGSASAVVEYCVVCLEKLAVGDSCRLLPHCSHCFHAPCIDSWLLQTPVCPICRSGVDVDDDSPVSDSDSDADSDSGEQVSVFIGDG